MSVLVIERDIERDQGLRPLDVLRDLDGIGGLIDVAFAEDMAQDGASVHSDLAALSATSPLLWLLRNISSEMRDSLDGFVWSEDGRIVGNATLVRDDPDRHVWTISNVAVHPDYRRSGIGRALMNACLERVEQRGGGQVVLEVKAGNSAAYDLYRRIGFQFVDGTVTARHPGRPTQPLPLAGRMRRVPSAEWRQLFDLARSTRSETAERLRALRIQDYDRTAWRRLADGFSDVCNQEERVWLALDGNDGYRCAVHLHLRRLGGSSANLFIHPDHRRLVEETAIQSILAACTAGRPVTVQVSSGDEPAQAVLWEYGFNEVRHLHRLMMDV